MPEISCVICYGPVDQLEDRYLRKVEAAGSNPAQSILKKRFLSLFS